MDENALLMITLVLDEVENHQVKKRKWVHQAWKKRKTEGEFTTFYKKLMDDEAKSCEYLRMSEYAFKILLRKLEVNMEKQDTSWRKSISLR